MLLAVGFVVWRRAPAPDRSLQRVQQAGVLVVGLDPSYPPFEVVNGQGKLAGYDVDLAREVARKLGVQVKFVTVDFGGIFDALQVGKFDVILGGVSPQSDDSKIFSYSTPYFDDGLVLVVDSRAPGNVIGIESGSDADLNLDQLKKRFPDDRFQQFDDQDQIRAAIVRGAIHGTVVDAVTGIIWARQIPAVTVEPTRLTSVPFVIASRSGDQKLLQAINRVIDSLRVDGYLASLQTKWLK